MARRLAAQMFQDYNDWAVQRREAGVVEQRETRKINIPTLHPAFDRKGWLLGDGEQNLVHVSQGTGVLVALFGENNGSIHFELQGSPEGKWSLAEVMVKDLIQQMTVEYASWVKAKALVDIAKTKEHSTTNGKSSGKGSGRNKNSSEEPEYAEHRCRELIKDVENQWSLWSGGDVDGFKGSLKVPATASVAPVRRELIGISGQNVLHIQNETGASVKLQGGTSQEPAARFEVSCSTSQGLADALSLCADLIKHVTGKNVSGAGQAGKREGNGKGVGKSGGKSGKRSKDRATGRGEPLAKRRKPQW